MPFFWVLASSAGIAQRGAVLASLSSMHPWVHRDPPAPAGAPRSQARWGSGAVGGGQTFVSGYILHLHIPHLSHVAQHGEDDKAREEAGEAVHRTGDECIPGRQKAGRHGERLSPPCTPTAAGKWAEVLSPWPWGSATAVLAQPRACTASCSGCSPVAVVVEVVVTGQSQKNTESGTQGEENLCSSINPDLAEATGSRRMGGCFVVCPPHSRPPLGTGMR